MRKLAHSRLPESRAIHPRDIDGVTRFLGIKLHQFGRCQSSRESAIGRMIPAARPDAGRVAEAALHFIGERDRGDQIAAIRADALRDGERRGDVVARVRRFFGKISVVVIEIANATAGRERRPIRRRLVIGADNGAAVFRRKIGSDFARDRARLFVPCAERAAKRINHPPLHLVHHFRCEIFVS